MPTVAKSCVIEKAYYEDGVWDVIASVKIGENSYTAGHRFEGLANMTDAALKAAVLDLY
jgi:hypothetical protein